jgi:endonuclease/exonuclease/phosphatase family metal-dependent hydrolase
MSYNVKGLPEFVLSRQYRKERFAVLRRLLEERLSRGAGPDLLLLQEAFSDSSRTLLSLTGLPYQTEGPGSQSLLELGSGLLVLSRFPILEGAGRDFGSLCLGFDCMARKAVQLIRVRLPEIAEPLEVYCTHLQAGRGDSAVRLRQARILVEFYRAHHQLASPVIFAGDFNFRPVGHPSYQEFEQFTGLAHAGRMCLERGCATQDDRGWHGVWKRSLDHQFYASSESVALEPVLVERLYREKVEGLRLSDHPALEVTYEIKALARRRHA